MPGIYSSLYSFLVHVAAFGVDAFAWRNGERRNIVNKSNFITKQISFILFYTLLRILVEEIIVPNKTSRAPKKKFMFIVSLKNKIPQIDPNKTCK